jgi:hypothetical protein
VRQQFSTAVFVFFRIVKNTGREKLQHAAGPAESQVKYTRVFSTGLCDWNHVAVFSFIGTGSEIHESAEREFRSLSTPEEARQFVQATCVDVGCTLASSKEISLSFGGADSYRNSDFDGGCENRFQQDEVRDVEVG